MKIRISIILNILLLLTIIFSSGINAHPDSRTRSYILEQGSDSNYSENKLSHHFDISDEDQIDQSLKNLLPEMSECQKSGLYSLPRTNNSIDPVWQPPKRF